MDGAVPRRPQAALFFVGSRPRPLRSPDPPEEVIVLGLTRFLAASNGSSGSGLAPLLLLVLMGGFFYFLMIRPQQRRARAQRELLSSIQVGDEVMTIGGIYGTVRAVEEDRVTIEVSPNVDLTFSKTAIARKLVYDEDDYEEEEEQEEEEADEPS
jgi:preprotein translocase subunit YajC